MNIAQNAPVKNITFGIEGYTEARGWEEITGDKFSCEMAASAFIDELVEQGYWDKSQLSITEYFHENPAYA